MPGPRVTIMPKLYSTCSQPHFFETHTIQVGQTTSRFYVAWFVFMFKFGNNEVWKNIGSAKKYDKIHD